MIDEPDSMDWTPGECCRDAANECDKHDVDAVLVIFLNKGKKGSEYNTGFRNAGLCASEAVSLLEIVKQDFISHIRNI